MGKQNEIAVIRFFSMELERGAFQIFSQNKKKNKEELNNCMHINFSNSTSLQSVLNIFTSVFRVFLCAGAFRQGFPRSLLLYREFDYCSRTL